MNRTELIADFKANLWVGAVTSLTQLDDDRDATNMYSFNYFETGSKVAVWKTATLYVMDEGLDTESAYFKDRYPTQSVSETNALVEQYADQIAAVKGNVVTANDNFIVVEAYETVDSVTSKVTYIADGDEIKKLTE